MKRIITIISVLFLLSQCKTDPNSTNTNTETTTNNELKLNDAPTFNEDSAYIYVKKQVDFGPRVPNSTAHTETKQWLSNFLKQYADTVIEQNADLKAFDGNILKSTNIIASFNTENKDRILLCAHWDTRPFADQDKENIKEPITGANDGASGVAVLLEIARQIKTKGINKGIDIILFDAEDYGQPNFSTDDYMPNSYCLGSQYWAKNLHTPNYKAQFGILLDMVGAPNAVFTMEGTSVNFANDYLHQVWKIAHAIGYSSYFSYKETSPITDDHLYINQIAKIPTLDIIHYDATTPSGFGWYWHTHKDNMDAIDKNTLKAVGQTVLQTIYQD
ncbi:MAG: M28 family peptidase [Chitinophagales bacterium]|nr:M28 family peptidase [Chitinophagales bacterium]